MILHSQIIGTGKPFVILHGFLGMGDNWKTLANQFAEDGYEVHLVDQRNHGRSFHDEAFSYELMAQDLLEYANHHELRDFILLGHSMGGKTAMEFSVAYPERVLKLLVADISPKPYPSHHQDILKALSSLDFSEISSRGEADKVLATYIPDLGTRQFLLKNLYWKEKGKLALRINLPVLYEKVEAVGRALSSGTVYNGPVLFLKGESSGYIEPLDELLIHKHFPKATIETVAKAGHWLHAENPTEFYQIVTKFL
ncbi:MAG TPA: alpha/beta hydrolase [Flavobacteriaceae bacterium]|nr:alpha/beta hydrolase [Flavobacteriaceae bacterium]MAM30251.1 alpha/beta hydrolase [Flavobacteriaceae bacterium]MAY53187.1 alpha/beta hydrolase [Flavobacteriaceae bacterium]HBR52987.1 alpha/beta hydrolase [Flavobacteriaceae bacterium]|tara:strand:+ start:168 stop:929 length:762 start_codon:yes stop_codon:yes gene_type:complete